MAHELDLQGEWQRLYELYHAMSDVELLELAERPDDLTDVARDVIGREIKARNLQVVHLAVPPPQGASILSSTYTPGFVWLDGYYDAIEARSACECLDEAEIEFEIRDLAQPRYGLKAQGGPAVDLQIFVNSADQSRAMALLHEKLGRFPVPEADRFEAPSKDNRWRNLNTFFDALEAGRACRFLEEAGVVFDLEDQSTRQQGVDKFTEGPAIWMNLLVEARDHDLATHVLREKMGLFPLQEVAVSDEPVDDGMTAGLGFFESEQDATILTRVLAEHGVWHRVLDHTAEVDTEKEYAFEVQIKEIDLPRATALVEQAMSFDEGDE